MGTLSTDKNDQDIILQHMMQELYAGIYKKMYPIGVIFEWCDSGISTGAAPDLSTVAKVQEYFGFGTWESYGEGEITVAKGKTNGTYASASNGFVIGESNVGVTEATVPNHQHPHGTHTHTSSEYQTYSLANGDGSKRTGPYGVGSGHTGSIGTGVNSDYSGYTASSGGNWSVAKGNMPPYIVVYRYRRIA